MAEEDSSDNAFSFAGHAAAPAAGTQSNSSQSFDTGGSETSELRPSTSRRPLVAPKREVNADNASNPRQGQYTWKEEIVRTTIVASDDSED